MAQVIERHSATLFHVYMMGFLPGFPYMGALPAELELPRRVNPRLRVPAGSVSIAMAMTNVYSLESPGGWHLIGRTPVPLWNLRRARAGAARGRRQGAVHPHLAARARGDLGPGCRGTYQLSPQGEDTA